MSPRELPSWRALEEHQSAQTNVSLRELFALDPERFERFSLQVGDLLIDYSKQRVTTETLTRLVALAREAGVERLRDQMFAGERINVTEDRAVLHVALRDRCGNPKQVDGKDVMPEVQAALDHMRAFSTEVRSGRWHGYHDRPITDVVNIGIGGSDLGPAMATEALGPYATDGPRLHFVSNVDPAQLHDTLTGLQPSTTLFTIASKTFTTQETMANARSAREWFLATAGDERHIARHFVAISTNRVEVERFGIAPEQMFVFWDWVGGRYSLWSSIGLPIMLATGPERFDELLEGASAIDEHFRTAPLEANAAVLLGLLGVWNGNFLGASSHAVLPYEQRLRRFPAFLQQLDMESNGKRVRRDGAPTEVETGAVVWGEPGTNGQHAFYQLLHQGTRVTPVDVLVAAESETPLGDQQLWLIANALAQTQALAFGKTREEADAELLAQGLTSVARARLVPHKEFPGNRPSTTIVYPRLTPRVLGQLIALYEHKVFTMGAIWGINSFDQWGVELGKQLALRVRPELEAAENVTSHDASTNGLINHVRALRDAGGP